MPDADMDKFSRELADTGPGLRFRLAVREGAIAIRKIRTIAAMHGPDAYDRGSCEYHDLQAWRRQYIKCCNAATAAIDSLWAGARWPTDAGHDATFIWKPTREV